MKQFRKTKLIINAIVITTMALLFSCKAKVENPSIIIYNKDSGKNLIYSLNPSECFTIEFVHSVNKSPVKDYYKVTNKGKILNYRTDYYNFGAGVPTELENNEVMHYGENGEIIIKNIDKEFEKLEIYLSDIYDHKLKIGEGEEISLWQNFGKKCLIEISAKK